MLKQNKTYDLIWTDHALERFDERRKGSKIYVPYPEKLIISERTIIKEKSDGSYEIKTNFGGWVFKFVAESINNKTLKVITVLHTKIAKKMVYKQSKRS